MRASTTILLSWALLSVAFATGGTGGAEASEDGEEDQARLEIRGSPGTDFSGSRVVGDDAPEEIGGQLPETSPTALTGGRSTAASSWAA